MILIRDRERERERERAIFFHKSGIPMLDYFEYIFYNSLQGYTFSSHLWFICE